MDPFITLSCPSCGGKVQVSERHGRFVCEYCGNEHMLQTSGVRVEPPAVAPIRPRIPLPNEVRVEKDSHSAAIYQRWFSFKYVPMLFFCIAWDSFLIFWYSIAFSQDVPWIFVVFPVGHLAVGIGITYSTLAGFINRTVLEITPSELSVWFEPLPWLGEKRVKTADLKQFFCKKKAVSRKRGVTYTYQLYAVTQDNHQILLLSNLDSPDLALFFEQQIESWLHIEDQAVFGELAHEAANGS